MNLYLFIMSCDVQTNLYNGCTWNMQRINKLQDLGNRKISTFVLHFFNTKIRKMEFGGILRSAVKE